MVAKNKKNAMVPAKYILTVWKGDFSVIDISSENTFFNFPSE